MGGFNEVCEAFPNAAHTLSAFEYKDRVGIGNWVGMWKGGEVEGGKKAYFSDVLIPFLHSDSHFHRLLH